MKKVRISKKLCIIVIIISVICIILCITAFLCIYFSRQNQNTDFDAYAMFDLGKDNEAYYLYKGNDGFRKIVKIKFKEEYAGIKTYIMETYSPDLINSEDEAKDNTVVKQYVTISGSDIYIDDNLIYTSGKEVGKEYEINVQDAKDGSSNLKILERTKDKVTLQIRYNTKDDLYSRQVWTFEKGKWNSSVIYEEEQANHKILTLRVALVEVYKELPTEVEKWYDLFDYYEKSK